MKQLVLEGNDLISPLAVQGGGNSGHSIFSSVNKGLKIFNGLYGASTTITYLDSRYVCLCIAEKTIFSFRWTKEMGRIDSFQGISFVILNLKEGYLKSKVSNFEIIGNKIISNSLVHKIHSTPIIPNTTCLSDIPNMTWEYKMLFSPRAGFLHTNSKCSINSSTIPGTVSTQLSTHQSTQ